MTIVTFLNRLLNAPIAANRSRVTPAEADKHFRLDFEIGNAQLRVKMPAAEGAVHRHRRIITEEWWRCDDTLSLPVPPPPPLSLMTACALGVCILVSFFLYLVFFYFFCRKRMCLLFMEKREKYYWNLCTYIYILVYYVLGAYYGRRVYLLRLDNKLFASNSITIRLVATGNDEWIVDGLERTLHFYKWL